jgi:hypothetical protein
MNSCKCEVRAVGESSFNSNALRFATEEECTAYGNELLSRWFGADTFRVVPSDDAVNYKFENGRAVRIEG